jgi:hypothetical protein
MSKQLQVVHETVNLRLKITQSSVLTWLISLADLFMGPMVPFIWMWDQISLASISLAEMLARWIKHSIQLSNSLASPSDKDSKATMFRLNTNKMTV